MHEGRTRKDGRNRSQTSFSEIAKGMLEHDVAVVSNGYCRGVKNRMFSTASRWIMYMTSPPAWSVCGLGSDGLDVKEGTLRQ